MTSVVEYENLITTSFSDANKSCPTSGALPHWKRKQMEASNSLTENSHISPNEIINEKTDITDIKQPFGKHSRVTSNRGCRFIPNRAAMDLEISAHSLRAGTPLDEDAGENDEEYKAALNSGILGIEEGTRSPASHRILSFKYKAPAPKGGTVNHRS